MVEIDRRVGCRPNTRDAGASGFADDTAIIELGIAGDAGVGGQIEQSTGVVLDRVTKHEIGAARKRNGRVVEQDPGKRDVGAVGHRQCSGVGNSLAARKDGAALPGHCAAERDAGVNFQKITIQRNVSTNRAGAFDAQGTTGYNTDRVGVLQGIDSFVITHGHGYIAVGAIDDHVVAAIGYDAGIPVRRNIEETATVHVPVNGGGCEP